MEAPQLIADYACETGENPLWHPFEKRLYWCDIPQGRIFRYDPATGEHEQCYQDRPVGGFTVQGDGSLLLFMDRGTIAVWRDGQLTEIVHEIPAELNSRFNDVIADPRGRVLCGTMSSPDGKGRLYRLDTDGSLHVLLENIGCSNGLAFPPDGTHLYYTDSFAYAIYRFDYDLETGALSNRQIHVQLTPEDGFPDGMTIDSQGRLWSALWDGYSLVRFNAGGEIAQRVHFPTKKVSSLTFGGESYSDIYVTTAGGVTREEDGPLAGALFRLRSEVPGVPEFLSRIRI